MGTLIGYFSQVGSTNLHNCLLCSNLRIQQRGEFCAEAINRNIFSVFFQPLHTGIQQSSYVVRIKNTRTVNRLAASV